MELINRRLKIYGAPNAAYNDLRRRICAGQPLEAPPIAAEQEFNTVASYAASQWVKTHRCSVRGVRIDKLSIRVGDKHVWCLFPDGRIMVVAEANIDAAHIRNSDVPQAQE